MQTYTLDRQDWIVAPSGERFLIGKRIGSGSFGRVHEVGVDKIIKIMRLDPDDGDEENLVQEVTIQQKLSEKEPGVCPKVYAFGKIVETGEYLILMEKCVNTARNLFEAGAKEEDFLDYYEQIANIMSRLEKYQFNHRDLKSDNVMYKLNEAGKKQYLLIDFGYSCATIDGVNYAGTTYFKPGEKCFRRSRDLAQMIYESLFHLTVAAHPNLRKFAQLVLTFKFKGKTCDMSKGCFPDFNAEWADTYDFLNRDDVENPNTTPEGLQKAIMSYRQGGLKSCQAGFIVNPINDECVPEPGAPAAAALKPAISPKPHLASPVVASSKKTKRKKASKALKDCPPGKVRNPKTRRCVKDKMAKPCPPGKVRNPATGRCVKTK